MFPLRGSVNPMTPSTPYADLMTQRRPLQTTHTFSTKLKVHFCNMVSTTISCIYSKWSPHGVL